MEKPDARRSMCCARADRGSAGVVAVAVVMVLSVAMLVPLGELGGRVVDRTRAQTAADAAALAGLSGGRSAAAAIAARHDAYLVEFAEGAGSEVIVTVRVGDVDASARATDAP